MSSSMGIEPCPAKNVLNDLTLLLIPISMAASVKIIFKLSMEFVNFQRNCNQQTIDLIKVLFHLHLPWTLHRYHLIHQLLMCQRHLNNPLHLHPQCLLIKCREQLSPFQEQNMWLRIVLGFRTHIGQDIAVHVELASHLRMAYAFASALSLRNRFLDQQNSFTKFQNYIVWLTVRIMNNSMVKNVHVLRASTDLQQAPVNQSSNALQEASSSMGTVSVIQASF